MTDSAIAISCVVPAYQSASMIARCLASILAQTGITPEIVVVDDSSTLDVRACVDALAVHHPQIRYAAGARTGRPADNWNLGLERARGRYVVLVHHDETLIDPLYLRRAVDRLDAGGGGLLVASHELAGDGGRSRFALVAGLARRLRLPPWTLYGANWLGPTASVVFSPRADVRFDPDLTWLVDVDFYARLLAGRQALLRDDAVSVRSLRHPDQITARIHPRRLALMETRSLAGRPDRGLRGWRGGVLILYAALRVPPWRWFDNDSRPAPAGAMATRWRIPR